MKQGRIKYSAFPLLLLSGCVSLGEYPSKVELPIQIDAKRFATCMAPLSARLKPGVDDIFRSLTPLSGASLLSKNIKPIFGIDPWFVENQWNILSRIDDLADDFGEGLQVFQKTDGPTLDLSSVFRGEIANAATDLPADVLKVAERTEAYFLAYNKGMAKIGLPKKIGGAEGLALAKRLSSILETTPETSEQRKALKEIIEDILGTSTADTASSLTSGGGFVARDGTVYAFPGVLPTNNGGVSIDHNQLGADAIRIILESLRDSWTEPLRGENRLRS